MKRGGMRAHFDLSERTITEVALRIGLKFSKTYPQDAEHVKVIQPQQLGSRDRNCTIDGYTIGIMRLIAALAAEGKECLISCKSVGY